MVDTTLFGLADLHTYTAKFFEHFDGWRLPLRDNRHCMRNGIGLLVLRGYL
jgi:hypothetical protein